jgi:hypothetical protein
LDLVELIGIEPATFRARNGFRIRRVRATFFEHEEFFRACLSMFSRFTAPR